MAISTVTDPSGSGRVDVLTSPVAAARAVVATGAWVKSKHDMYLIRGSVAIRRRIKKKKKKKKRQNYLLVLVLNNYSVHRIYVSLSILCLEDDDVTSYYCSYFLIFLHQIQSTRYLLRRLLLPTINNST